MMPLNRTGSWGWNTQLLCDPQSFAFVTQYSTQIGFHVFLVIFLCHLPPCFVLSGQIYYQPLCWRVQINFKLLSQVKPDVLFSGWEALFRSSSSVYIYSDTSCSSQKPMTEFATVAVVFFFWGKDLTIKHRLEIFLPLPPGCCIIDVNWVW